MPLKLEKLCVDRYLYSGVVELYSAARYGLSKEWCISKEDGPILPDIVFWLDIDPIICAMRYSQREKSVAGSHGHLKLNAGILR